MILEIGIFVVGVAALVYGAYLLVRGGSQVAAVLGIPPVVVGLTVVAFGTSAPELFVSLVGALRGNTGLVLGNVIGSNVANLGIILAVAAVMQPLKVERGLIRWNGEVAQMLAATLLLSFLAWDRTLSRPDSLALVFGFAGFMIWALRSGRSVTEAPDGETPATKLGPMTQGMLRVVGGIVGLAVGGQMIVSSAMNIAARFGISETLIGLTLVAVGTSLPELATTIMAAWKKENDLALGNIIGSNLFNILAVAGPVGLIKPLEAENGQLSLQLFCMTGLTLVVTALLVLGRGSFGRKRGALLLLLYVIIMSLWMTRP